MARWTITRPSPRTARCQVCGSARNKLSLWATQVHQRVCLNCLWWSDEPRVDPIPFPDVACKACIEERAA